LIRQVDIFLWDWEESIQAQYRAITQLMDLKRSGPYQARGSSNNRILRRKQKIQAITDMMLRNETLKRRGVLAAHGGLQEWWQDIGQWHLFLKNSRVLAGSTLHCCCWLLLAYSYLFLIQNS
jgi:hypothetical protein